MKHYPTEAGLPMIENLKHEHAELDRQLVEFDSRAYLTPEEQLERKRIQKLKLLKKDQIELLRLRKP